MMNTLHPNDDIIVYCAAGYGEKICIQLLSLGHHVVCFCDNAKKNEGIFLLGIPVYNYNECRKQYPQAVYVIANSNKATALEIATELERDGFVKNLSYFNSVESDLKGEFPEVRESVLHVFRDKTLILYGNLFLCDLFEKWIKKSSGSIEVHICSAEDIIIDYKNKYRESIWIPLEFTSPFFMDSKKTEALFETLHNYNIVSFSRFFLHYMIFCEEESVISNNTPALSNHNIFIKKVAFLKSAALSGASFINSVMDFHPNILYLGFNALGINIWRVVKMAAKVPNEKKVEVIIDMAKEAFAGESTYSFSLEEYGNILEKYIQPHCVYSERDLFIRMHLAHYELIHGTTPVGEVIIYMDVHDNAIQMRDIMLSWLKCMGFQAILLEMVRNPYKRFGSGLKLHLRKDRDINRILGFLDLVSGESFEKTEEKYEIIRMRFEDLKMYPKQILQKLCNILEIPWSDTFLETTLCGEPTAYVEGGGKGITGFELKPVYHTYDEYFDAFDKLRLDMIFREKNKAYGYSYVHEEKYTEMLLKVEDIFKIPFKFEEYLPFPSETARERFRNKMQMLCENILFFEDNKDIYKGHFCFGDYLTVEDD